MSIYKCNKTALARAVIRSLSHPLLSSQEADDRVESLSNIAKITMVDKLGTIFSFYQVFKTTG